MSDATIGPLGGHLARPAGSGPWPALIVIQEWWGLDDQTKHMADRFAAEGYLAFAPDIYHGQRAELGDRDTATRLSQQYSPGAAAELQGLFDALKPHPECNGKVGAVGFCFGGRMALTLATSRPLDAVCTFYGGGMQQLFDRLDRLGCPVLGLFGDKDQSIPVGTVEEFERLLAQHGIAHEVKVYPNAGHAFMRANDPAVYRPEAAADAWPRATAFFARHLKE